MEFLWRKIKKTTGIQGKKMNEFYLHWCYSLYYYVYSIFMLSLESFNYNTIWRKNILTDNNTIKYRIMIQKSMLFFLIPLPVNFFQSIPFLTISYLFRLFPIISISQKFFSFFFLTLEKIGIDEKVICCHNISN